MDVGTANLLITTGVAIVLAAAFVLIVRSVRRSRSQADALSATETVVVSFVGSGALLAIPLSAYSLIASGVRLAGETVVRVTGIPAGETVYPPVLAASDAPVDAGYESTWIDVANLPSNVRWLLWSEGALPTLMGLVIAVAILWLALALLRSTPFTRAFPWVLGVVAIVIIAAGLGSQILGAIARAETIAFLGPPELITGPGGFPAFELGLDLGPVGWGLGIALVAAAFSIGTRLQRDTRGLV